METVVVYNAGRDAAKRGDVRQAPDAIDYPIVSRYQPYHTVEATLSGWMKREWLRGFDSARNHVPMTDEERRWCERDNASRAAFAKSFGGR